MIDDKKENRDNILTKQIPYLDREIEKILYKLQSRDIKSPCKVNDTKIAQEIEYTIK